MMAHIRLITQAYFLVLISSSSCLRSDWYQRCQPLEHAAPASPTIDTVVRFPDGSLYLFFGDLVSRVSNFSLNMVEGILTNLIADDEWPRPISEVWPSLESDLTSVFRLQDQVFFLKRNKAWVLWPKTTKPILGPFPISQALPFLVGLGQVDAVSAMHFQHEAWLLVFHKIKGQNLMSTIDASTSRVLSTQSISREVVAFEIIDQTAPDKFVAIQFDYKSYHIVSLSTLGLLHSDCQQANEPLIGKFRARVGLKLTIRSLQDVQRQSVRRPSKSTQSHPLKTTILLSRNSTCT